MTIEPPRRGRRPLVDVAPLLETARENRGEWTYLEMETNRARSVYRQVRDLPDIDVSVSSLKDGTRRVFLRAK